MPDTSVGIGSPSFMPIGRGIRHQVAAGRMNAADARRGERCRDGGADAADAGADINGRSLTGLQAGIVHRL